MDGLIWHVATILIALSIACVPIPCTGQSPVSTDPIHVAAEADTAQRLQKGARLVVAGGYDQALHHLRPLFRTTPTYVSPTTNGSVAYWIGRAYQASGRPEKALMAFRKGVEGTELSQGKGEIALVDEFIQQAVKHGDADDQRQASDLYLQLLRQTGSNSLSDVERETIRRYLREVAVLLPEGVQSRTGLHVDPVNLEINFDLQPDAGEILAGWWRKQDPLPATTQNERIREHLRRVSHVRRHLSHNGRMDDRGKIYIRFGEPRRDVSIGMEHEETANEIDTRIRRNEFWTYHHVHQKAYYLFVEREPHRFRLEGADELFPPDMKTGISGGNGRSREKALSYIYRLEEAFRELATFHADYASRASDIFERAAWARDNEQYGIGSDPIDGTVGDFVRSMESRIENEERQNAIKRAREVPQSYTKTDRDSPSLPVATRVARFLTPEGKTRLEVYWSLPTSSLFPTSNPRENIRDTSRSAAQSFLQVTAVREEKNHHREKVQSRQYRVREPKRSNSILPPQTLSTVTNDSVFHVALQYDQYSAVESPHGNLQPGRLLRRHTERHDTLTALTSEPERLEISDLRLLTTPANEPPTAVTSANSIPYPFERVRSGAPLALSFELYHLSPDAQGRTEYTVAYKVRRQSRGSGRFFGLFGGKEDETTTTATTYQGQNRRSEEYILLDLDGSGRKSGEVEITVNVKDEVTGQQVSRSLCIEMVSSEQNG